MTTTDRPTDALAVAELIMEQLLAGMTDAAIQATLTAHGVGGDLPKQILKIFQFATTQLSANVTTDKIRDHLVSLQIEEDLIRIILSGAYQYNLKESRSKLDRVFVKSNMPRDLDLAIEEMVEKRHGAADTGAGHAPMRQDAGTARAAARDPATPEKSGRSGPRQSFWQWMTGR
ncbi:MAG: hypothetical protein H7838_03360 [Magnetococcus sp. DMHC-8]